jgi:hypothetical protein
MSERPKAWHPMLPRSGRGRTWADLDLWERTEVIGEYVDWDDDELAATRWEKVPAPRSPVARDELAPPGCVLCVLGSTEPPPVPDMLHAAPLELVRVGLLTGIQVATKYLFVYGVEAVHAELCAEHRAVLDKPVHGGGHG